MPTANKTTIKRQRATSRIENTLVLHGTKYTKIKTLGMGIYGTTYEVVAHPSNLIHGKPNQRHMAFKVQKIMPEHRRPDTEYQLWREIDFQKEFISKLAPDDRQFFLKQFTYEIISNCNHLQKRAKINTIIRPKNKWELKLLRIDKSPFCAYFLMELVNGLTVEEFMNKRIQPTVSTTHTDKLLPHKLLVSMAQQFIKCLSLLMDKGYGHNDEHFGNLMLTPLSPAIKPSFILGGKQLQKFEYQLKLIDYGLVNHPKFKQPEILQKYQMLFLERPDLYYYIVAQRVISDLFTNFTACKLIYQHEKKQEPRESSPRIDYRLNLLKNISMNHPGFLDAAVSKYSAQYPELRDFLTQIFKTIRDDVTPNLIKDPSQPDYPRNRYYLSEILDTQIYAKPYQSYLTEFVLLKITEEFRTKFTRQHLEYSGYEILGPRMLEFLGPKKDYLVFLGLTTLEEVIDWVIKLT
jgi:serine/threonine protein kinase